MDEIRKIFITHAAADAELVEKIIELLRMGMDIDGAQIFASSSITSVIPSGEDFKAYIRQKLNEASVSIALITRNYYASLFGVCELGWIWFAGKRLIPMVVPPLGYDDLKAVLVGLQTLRIDREDDLDQLRDELGGSGPVANWNLRKNRFLTELDDVLPKLPDPYPVMDRSRLAAILSQETTGLMPQGSGWAFDFSGIPMLCMVDENANRMRIFALIGEVSTLTDEQRSTISDANFRSALDARYATTNNVLVSLFLHELSSLEESRVRMALRQVASLVVTFGSTYSSGTLVLGSSD